MTGETRFLARKQCCDFSTTPVFYAARTTQYIYICLAGINYVDIGDLAAGAVVTIGKVDGTDVWVQIDQGKWMALAFKGEKYVEAV